MDELDHLVELSTEQEQIFQTLLEELYDGIFSYLQLIRFEILDLIHNYDWSRQDSDLIQQWIKRSFILGKFKHRFELTLIKLRKQKQLAKEIFVTALNQLQSTINAPRSEQALGALFNNMDELTKVTSSSIVSHPILSLILCISLIPIASFAVWLLIGLFGPLFAFGYVIRNRTDLMNPTAKLHHIVGELKKEIYKMKREKKKQIISLASYFQNFRESVQDHSTTSQYLPTSIVWFDQYVHTSNENRSYVQVLAKNFSNEDCHIILIDNTDQLVTFIQTNTSTQFIVITTGSFGEQIVSQIGYYFNLKGILVFCSNVHYHRAWAQQHKKVLLVTNSFDQVIAKINDVKNGNIYFVQYGFSYEDITLKLTRPHYYLSTKENGFIIHHLSDIRIDIDYHKDKMINLHQTLMSKNYFPDQFPHYLQLDKLIQCAEEFVHALQQPKPEEHLIRLYTAPRPCYCAVINTILNLLDESLIRLADDLIKALRCALLVYNDRSNRIPNSTRVKLYRGICLADNNSYQEFVRKFKVNDWIVLPAFTSTSLDVNTAAIFAGPKGVLLEISVDCTKPDKPKHVSAVSNFFFEDEVILNCFSSLKVRDISQIGHEVLLYRCTLEQ